MKKININESHLIFGFFDKFLRIKKGLLIDVGAHVGNSMRPFVDRGWEVHAFEPEANNFEELKNNYKSHESVVVNNLAVSDVVGIKKFYISTKYWGIHSLKPFDKSHNKIVNIATVTLKKYLDDRKLGHVNFLKIDTEGADLLVLKGCRFDADRPDVVMVEYMDKRSKKYFGYSHIDMADLLISNRYIVFEFNWSNIVGGYSVKGVNSTTTNFVSFEKYPSNKAKYWGNLVAVKKEIATPFYLYVKFELVMQRLKSYLTRLSI